MCLAWADLSQAVNLDQLDQHCTMLDTRQVQAHKLALVWKIYFWGILSV